MTPSAFELLARPIQQILWDMRWRELRPIQVDAIREILGGTQDLIISARTAAGKTEAAFLPILSLIYEQPKPSLQAVYVGPLKALINDQFERLEDLCRRAEIPVHRWHGDVDQNRKQALLDDPRGVLLITPESLEALLIRRSSRLAHVLRHLSFVVIDEVHALMGSERGTQLRSLLSRYRRYTADDFRLVALSATLGDSLPAYAEWLRPGEPERVTLIHDPGEKKQVRFRISTFELELPGADAPPEGDGDSASVNPVVHRAYETFAGRKALFFCNNKADVEWLADSLNDCCRAEQRACEFLVHHGSLSKEVREFSEQQMKSNRSATIVCSPTLELGIDVGSVQAIGQLGPPVAVHSLLQRLGRSGRRDGEAQEMQLFVVEERVDEDTPLVPRLRPALLQSIALAELMKQRWVEPKTPPAYDFSTCAQQVLSSLAERGRAGASTLHRHLIAEGGFRDFDAEQFASLLRSLARSNLIEQISGGDLILTPRGEELVNDREFFSAFASDIEFRVVHEGRPIGQISASAVPHEGDRLLLGGRRWLVTHVFPKEREIVVTPSRGRKPARFLSGVGEIHPRVREEMRRVLTGDQDFPYLDDTGRQLLTVARRTARLSGVSASPVVPLAEDRSLWFTWTGSKAHRTLGLLCEAKGIDCVDWRIAFEVRLSVQRLQSALVSLLRNPPTPQQLASTMSPKEFRKFDDYLDESLLIQQLAASRLDLDEARRVLAISFQ